MKKRAIFLDRDGTIIMEKHYLKEASDVEFLEGAYEGLLLLQKMDFRLVIVTNQSGIKRGFFTAQDLENVHERLKEMLWERSITIDGIYFSPDLPDEPSGTRKPATGLITQATRELDLSLVGSYCIGDKAEDIEMGKRMGLGTILVLTGYGAKFSASLEPDYRATGLYDAARWIQKRKQG